MSKTPKDFVEQRLEYNADVLKEMDRDFSKMAKSEQDELCMDSFLASVIKDYNQCKKIMIEFGWWGEWCAKHGFMDGHDGGDVLA